MASGWTNKGVYEILGGYFKAVSLPSNFYVVLCTDAATPTVDFNTLSEMTQIAGGNGYTTNGYSLTPGATDFDVHTEDDTNNWGLIQVKDVVWTASGGPIPSSGSGARWSVITDDNATPASRLIIGFLDLTSARSVSDGQTLTLQDIEFRLTN